MQVVALAIVTAATLFILYQAAQAVAALVLGIAGPAVQVWLTLVEVVALAQQQQEVPLAQAVRA
jgi:hypothetical protein